MSAGQAAFQSHSCQYAGAHFLTSFTDLALGTITCEYALASNNKDMQPEGYGAA